MLVSSRLPATSAGIAIALVTGDQNAVDQSDADAMRRSGLTHLLSVSGLHIAAVVAFAMLLTLRLLALSETLALRLNLVLVAAAVAAAAGIGYTILTGMQVPTVRSCVAALLILAGMALGRDAISIRLIATGALVVLVFRPEALAGPSFQMSFAAVTSIVALHSTSWARKHLQRREEGFGARILRALVGIIVSGLAVEIALMPLALYHFHRSGSMKGAVALLPAMPAWAFGLMVCGGIWLCLWTQRWRLLGLIPVAVGAAAAALAPTPDLLVTGDGRHLAVVENGVPFILRDRAGDYVRGLLAEASGYDSDPDILDNQPRERLFKGCLCSACPAWQGRMAPACYPLSLPDRLVRLHRCLCVGGYCRCRPSAS
jgi:competence protein ComEC